VRLFFALWPDEAVREGLRRIARQPVRHAGGKPVTPANFHVTLKFLGNTDEKSRECLCAAADGLCFTPFELCLDTLGQWPKPRILWLGARRVPPALATLASDLDQAAVSCGFGPETRPYRPHVTLARKAAQAGRSGPVKPFVWRVDSFVLAASDTLPQGARYRVLRAFECGG
jgi:2'-5' RNA ligase